MRRLVALEEPGVFASQSRHTERALSPFDRALIGTQERHRNRPGVLATESIVPSSDHLHRRFEVIPVEIGRLSLRVPSLALEIQKSRAPVDRQLPAFF